MVENRARNASWKIPEDPFQERDAMSADPTTTGKPAATRHAIRGGEEIVQLLIGTDEPGETIESAGIRLTGDAKMLAQVLFPNRRPGLRPWDRY